MKKVLFVMNPFSGQKRANRYLPEIIQMFNQAGYEVTVHITSGHGDATIAVERMAADKDLVVCCGGDGTLNETITGLLTIGAKVPIGYIPAGTTNDFAASLKLSTNILQATQDILLGEAQSFDVGRFNGRYFSYVASFGAFTKSSYVVPQNIKNALGHAAYVLGGISELSQLRKEHLRLEIDGQVVEDDFVFGAICNATSIGGVLTLDPKHVDLSDGLFEVILVRMPRNLTELTEFIQAFQNQTYDCAMLTFRSAKSVKIFADPDMNWTLDGEREDGHREITVENLHHAIRLVKRVNAHA